MEIKAKLSCEGFSPEPVARSVGSILARTTLCSIATVGDDGSAHINTCFYAFNPLLDLIVLTPPATQHARNWDKRPRVAVTIFDSHQVSGSDLQGLQLFGTASLADGHRLEQALVEYRGRFPGLQDSAPTVDALLKNFQSRLFIVSVDLIKVFDEITFGKETWIVARIL